VLAPEFLVIAVGITVPKPVPPHCEVLYACLTDDTERICLGADEAGLRAPVLAVSGSGSQAPAAPDGRPAAISRAQFACRMDATDRLDRALRPRVAR